MTLVSAGHETTATAIGWAADLLAHNPDVAARLRESLAAGDRDYLKATAKEVLRARTVFYASAARHSLEPLRIGEWTIGTETLVLVDAQGVHGDPELWPEPEAFRPDRFLGEQPDGYSYVPFGGGAHRCLGAALASMELELVIEAIVTRVVLEPAGPPAEPVRRGISLAPGNRAKVRVAELQR
jgi:cytochrome P450